MSSISANTGRPGITVIIYTLQGQERFRYNGRILEQTPGHLLLEAAFTLPDRMAHGIRIAQGDRFVELYLANRWYNIFAIHDRVSADLKAWYCNLCYPPQFGSDTVSYIDLALDLLVYPDGSQIVLDEDEFAELTLPAETRSLAWSAMRALQEMFIGRRPGHNNYLGLLKKYSSPENIKG